MTEPEYQNQATLALVSQDPGEAPVSLAERTGGRFVPAGELSLGWARIAYPDGSWLTWQGTHVRVTGTPLERRLASALQRQVELSGLLRRIASDLDSGKLGGYR